MKAFVVWDNAERAFVESVGCNGITYSRDLNGALQFEREDMAEDVVRILPDGVMLDWR